MVFFHANTLTILFRQTDKTYTRAGDYSGTLPPFGPPPPALYQTIVKKRFKTFGARTFEFALKTIVGGEDLFLRAF